MILRYISRGKSNIWIVYRNNFSIKFSLALLGSYLHIFFQLPVPKIWLQHFTACILKRYKVEFMLHLRYQILQLSCQKTISIYVKNWNKFLSINFFRIRRKNKNKKPYKNKSCFRRNIKWIKKKIHTFGRYIQQNNIKTTPTQWLINLTNYF